MIQPQPSSGRVRRQTQQLSPVEPLFRANKRWCSLLDCGAAGLMSAKAHALVDKLELVNKPLGKK
jgi:hypothetical protein